MKYALCLLALGLGACSVETKSENDLSPKKAAYFESELNVGDSNFESNNVEFDSSIAKGGTAVFIFKIIRTDQIRLIPGFAAGINCDLHDLKMKVHIDEGRMEGEAQDLPLTFAPGTNTKVRVVIPPNSCEALSFDLQAKFI